MFKPTLTCWGGVGTVTGANFLLGTEKLKVMVDCGMTQGMDAPDPAEQDKFDYDPTSIDFLFITHAHVDHIGRIHKLVRAGFKGVIYSTFETKEIADLMIRDLLHIEGVNPEEVEKCMKLWQGLKYHEPKDFGDFKLELFDAGHILGSTMYKFTFPSGKSIFFTGDLGNSPSPLLKNTEEVTDLTYLLMDSVYGDRNHESAEERDKKFADVIADVVKRRSTLLIPSFSLERTQILLYELKKIFESGLVPRVPVYLDSPLAIRVTEIYRRVLPHGKDLFDFPKLKETTEARDSMEIDRSDGAKIILAGSGMSTAGRIVHHEARFLPHADATLLFVGYQAVGTLGRMIQEGMKQVIINNQTIEVRAKVVTINGFSAHAGSDQLVNFVSHTAKSLKNVFITMGEPKSSIFLAQRLHDELDVNAIVPERGKVYELDL